MVNANLESVYVILDFQVNYVIKELYKMEFWMSKVHQFVIKDGLGKHVK